MAANLLVVSLREALLESMGSPTALRDVTVQSVHLGQAAALLAFLKFQERRELWRLSNGRRLSILVYLNSLLDAVATDLLPRLLDSPTSQPVLLLVSRFASYIRDSAATVGGTFARDTTILCDDLVSHARTASRGLRLTITFQELRRRTKAIGERLRHFPSRHLTISIVPDTDYHPDAGTHDDDDMDFDLEVTTLREALQEAIDAPAAQRRLTVTSVHVSQSALLLAVLCYQCSARGWVVAGRDLHHLGILASVDRCFQAMADVLRILVDDPTSAAALSLLHDFARYINTEARPLGGEFRDLFTPLIDELIGHTNAATGPEIDVLRHRIVTFRSRHVPIDESGSESSDSGDDPSDTASASESE